MKAKPGSHRIWRVLLALSAAAAVLILSAALFLTRPFTEAPWQQAQPNPESIYENVEIGAAAASGIPIVSPFHLQTDPMKGLLLINFELDPDPIYVGFEPQFFDDAVHGRGLLVIGWRADGKVDVFYQAGLQLDPQTYGITGAGLHTMAERSFYGALFELGPAGVQADISFHDLQGRLVRLVVRETDPRPRTPFGLLAPMGSAASDPLILDGTPVHFLRYSAAPFIVTWNPDADARVRILEPDPQLVAGAVIADAEGVRYEVEENGAFREIRRMSRREGDHEVTVEFTPALPQLLAPADGVDVTGRFRITAQPSVGTVRGSWRVARRSRSRLRSVRGGNG